jgi:PAS domain S-box-containing protein
MNATAEPSSSTDDDASRLHAVLEAVAEGVLVFDERGRLTAHNDLAAAMWGFPEEMLERGDRWELVDHAAARVCDRDAFVSVARSIHAERFTPWSDVLRIADGRVFERRVAPYVVNGEVRGTVFAFRDVTELTRAQAQLEETELRYRTLTEQIPAVTYIEEAYEEGRTLFVSPQIETILGIPREEWLTSDTGVWLARVHPDDRERMHDEYLGRLRTRDRFHAEYRLVGADGRVVWVSEDDVYVPDPAGGHGLLHGLLFDITPVKEAQAGAQESEARVRVLLDRLMHAQEDERSKIAQDIEDELIQSLTGVGLRLASLKSLVKTEDAVEPLEAMERGIATSIRALRRLLFELRPRTLDTGGLVPALRSLLDGFDAETGTRSILLAQERSGSPPDQRLALFRIAQELLSNVRAHSGAAVVEVRVAEEDGGHLVEVSDDGVGFDPGPVAGQTVGHLGLLASIERAQAAGGWLRIESAPGAGTTVTAWLPDVVRDDA